MINLYLLNNFRRKNCIIEALLKIFRILSQTSSTQLDLPTSLRQVCFSQKQNAKNKKWAHKAHSEDTAGDHL